MTTTTAKTPVARETLEDFRSGQSEAFADLVRAYSPLVRSIAGRFWKSPFQREEAMQEIWAQVYSRREALDPSRLDEFPAWLTTLARNRCFDLLRKEGRSIRPGYDDPAVALEKLPAPAGQERAVESRDLLEAVRAFRERLKPRWRSFFELHFVEGLGYPEIAARLSISRARCKYLKRVLAGRARRDARLLEALGHRGQIGGGHETR